MISYHLVVNEQLQLFASTFFETRLQVIGKKQRLEIWLFTVYYTKNKIQFAPGFTRQSCSS